MPLPWLDPIWQRLVAYKMTQRMPTGLMLCGLPGIGKATLAKQYAQFVLCHQSTHQACGQCRSCTLFNAGNHPDFIELHPEEDSSTIKIDQIRELVATVAQTSALGTYQVVTIIKAEDMNRSAANALLKTLEEPHGAVLLLLVSEQPHAVPATIRSRCQILTVPMPSKSAAITWLKSALPNEQHPEVLLGLADYLPMKALQYAQSSHVQLRDELLTILPQIRSGQVDPIKIANDYVKQTKEILELLLTLTQDMIRLQFCFNDNLNHHDKLVQLSLISSSFSVAQLYQYLDVLLEAVQSFKLRNNVNTQLLMEKIFIHWRYPNYVS
jgi:DNA polymerase-3 subunit delta'